MVTHVYFANVFRNGKWHSTGWSVRAASAAKARSKYLLHHPNVRSSALRIARSTSPLSRKVANPTRKPIDHKFAGALFSAGHPKTALAYLRGTLTKSTARELAAGKKRR